MITGTGITACLLQGVSCIAVEQDWDQCDCIERRVTAALFPDGPSIDSTQEEEGEAEEED